MNKAHYIIFHPEKKRQKINVQATALVNKQILTNWVGDIYVDKIGEGNEDPFVFNDPWLYSFCHATELRRNDRIDNYLQVGSKIFFASGQQANKGILTIDTVFVIGDIQKWKPKPDLQLPVKYQGHKNSESELWIRHFCFPFKGIHDKVSHTYEAELWQKGKMDYSFLPLSKIGERVSIPLDEFSQQLKDKILGKVKGKRPVLLTDTEIQTIATQIDSATETKVLKNINTNIQVGVSKIIKC